MVPLDFIVCLDWVLGEEITMLHTIATLEKKLTFDVQTCHFFSGFEAFVCSHLVWRQPPKTKIVCLPNEVTARQTQRGCDWQLSHLKIGFRGRDAKSPQHFFLFFFPVFDEWHVWRVEQGLDVSTLSHLQAPRHIMRHNQEEGFSSSGPLAWWSQFSTVTHWHGARWTDCNH